MYFGTAPLSGDQVQNAPEVECPCTVGCVLDLDAGAMTVFVDGELLAEQCEYQFTADREWFPSVGLAYEHDVLFSNAV